MPDHAANGAVGLTPAEMDLLVARAGLDLNPGQMADLVLIWRQMATLVAAIPRERPLAEDAPFPAQLAPPPGRGNDATGRR